MIAVVFRGLLGPGSVIQNSVNGRVKDKLCEK